MISTGNKNPHEAETSHQSDENAALNFHMTALSYEDS
jgi:hypothetical protein